MSAFWKKIKRDLKRLVIFFVIFSLAGSLWYTARKLGWFTQKAKYSAIIDADTGNGIDDLMAISRGLADDDLEIIGLLAAQNNFFPEQYSGSMERTREINDSLIQLFRNKDVRSFSGNPEMLIYDRSLSGAARFIIDEAKKWSPKKKLNIIALGPLTNIAAAIVQDSTIIPNIRVFAVSMKYDPRRKIWNKNEFNARNDVDALDLLINTDQLELHIMPAFGAGHLVFKKSELINLMDNSGKAGLFYINRINTLTGSDEIDLPSLTLMEIFLNSDFAKEEQISTPPENNRRRIYVYNKINRNYSEVDFWNTFKDFAVKEWNE